MTLTYKQLKEIIELLIRLQRIDVRVDKLEAEQLIINLGEKK